MREATLSASCYDAQRKTQALVWYLTHSGGCYQREPKQLAWMLKVNVIKDKIKQTNKGWGMF